ncbi:MAG: hypothetical protein ABIO31_02870 [Candidatus Nitrotoga sp.]
MDYLARIKLGLPIKMGVEKSTISREFKRNKSCHGTGGQNRCNRNVMSASKPVSMTSNSHRNSWAEIEWLIREDFSPVQAANRLELEVELAMGRSTGMPMQTTMPMV